MNEFLSKSFAQFSFFWILQAEQAQQEACDKFEAMSAKAKEELMDFKKRRVSAFKKNLIDVTELEIKHSKVWRKKLLCKIVCLLYCKIINIYETFFFFDISDPNSGSNSSYTIIEGRTWRRVEGQIWKQVVVIKMIKMKVIFCMCTQAILSNQKLPFICRDFLQVVCM